MYRAALVVVMLALAGCAPLRPPGGAEASIRWECSGCFPGQPVGYTPITAILYAEAPDGAQYLWDFGDGSGGAGRFVTHEYAQPGLYKVTLKATIKRGIMERLLSATTYFRALERPSAEVRHETVETKLFSVTFVLPKAIDVGELGQICFVVAPKARLTVFDFIVNESDSLFGVNGKFQDTWLYVSAPTTNCVLVKRISSGELWLDYHLFGATEASGERAEGRLLLP